MTIQLMHSDCDDFCTDCQGVSQQQRSSQELISPERSYSSYLQNLYHNQHSFQDLYSSRKPHLPYSQAKQITRKFPYFKCNLKSDVNLLSLAPYSKPVHNYFFCVYTSNNICCPRFLKALVITTRKVTSCTLIPISVSLADMKAFKKLEVSILHKWLENPLKLETKPTNNRNNA